MNPTESPTVRAFNRLAGTSLALIRRPNPEGPAMSQDNYARHLYGDVLQTQPVSGKMLGFLERGQCMVPAALWLGAAFDRGVDLEVLIDQALRQMRAEDALLVGPERGNRLRRMAQMLETYSREVAQPSTEAG